MHTDKAIQAVHQALSKIRVYLCVSVAKSLLHRLKLSQNAGSPCHVCSATRPFLKTSVRSQRINSPPPPPNVTPVPTPTPPLPPKMPTDGYNRPRGAVLSDCQVYT